MINKETKELMDYKVFNFNGKSKYIQVDCNRFTNHRKIFMILIGKFKIMNLIIKMINK